MVCPSLPVSYTHLDVYKRQPFVDGKKNEFLLKLGRIARYKGVGEELADALFPV